MWNNLSQLLLFDANLNLLPSQHRAASCVAEKLARAYPKRCITIAGHSKGGGNALYAALKNRLRYVIFNPVGIGEPLQREILNKEPMTSLKKEDIQQLEQLGEKYGRVFIVEGDFVADHNRSGKPWGHRRGIRVFGKRFYYKPRPGEVSHFLPAFPGPVVSQESKEFRAYHLHRPFDDFYDHSLAPAAKAIKDRWKSLSY